MSEQLTITITAKDGASQAFKAVGNSAQTMGSAIDSAGSEAKTAATNLDSAGSSASSLSDKMTTAGAAITAVGGALVYSGQQAMEHERLLIAVQAGYGDLADEMIGFADTLAGVTIFSDEDILAGERYFATLLNNYDLSIAQIQELMAVTADLASASGTTFENASSRVTAAIRGEGEAIEFLGLTMNQQSIDRQNLTLSMSNQEAAQFRLNALLDQAAVYQGTAQEVANSSIGTYASLTNTMQNLSVEVGNFIGPWGSLVTGFGTAAIGVSGTLGAFGKLGGVLKATSLGASALSLAFNPLTLAIGGVAAVGIGLFALFQSGKQTVDELSLSFDALNRQVDRLEVEGLDTEAGHLQDFVTDLEEVQARANELINDDDYLTAAVNNLIAQGHSLEEAVEMVDGALLLDNKDQFQQDIETISAALADPRIDQEQLSGVLAMYRNEFEMTGNLELYAERINYTASNLSNYRREAEETTAANAALGASFASIADGAGAAQGALSDIVGVVTDYSEAVQDLIAQGRAMSGLDDPLSTFNLAGLGDASTMVAERLGIVTSALENTYRIIVSNTNAMGQTAQSTEEWVTSLTDASEGVSQLQQLREAGIITDQEYLNVLAAQQVILQQNAVVHQEILGIQATQAPVLASLVEQQAAYLTIVGDMSAQQQLVALGWMDSATAAQAYEITTIAAAAANDQFGESGRAMTEQMVQGAVAANPVLGEMLEQMGLISIGADGTITIHYDSVEGAMSEMERLTMSIDALTIALGGIPPLHVDIDGSIVEADSLMAGTLLTVNALDGAVARVSVDAETADAEASMANTQAQHQSMDGQSATLMLDADESGALNAIGVTRAATQALNGQTATVYAQGNNSGALNSIGAAQGAVNALNGATATVYANAVDNASGVLAGVQGLINSINGAVATVTTNAVTVYSTIGSPVSAFQHGGIPEYATGGVTARMGEAGPELLHFPNGGTAWAPADALYTVPMGTLVSPANASKSALGGGGGGDIVFNNYGTVIGIDDVAEALEGALDRRRRGYGMGVTA